MDFQKFENEVAVTIPPTNGEPFMLVKSKPADISPAFKKRFLILGTLQIINGLLLIIFNIIGIFVRSAVTMYVVPGIWVGIFVVVSGTFGVVIHHSKTSRGYVVTFLVLSIISSVIVWCVIGIAIPGILEDSYEYYEYYYDGQIAINSVLLIIGVIEMVIAIIASAFGCGVMCGNSEPTRYIPVRMDMHTYKLVFENTSPPAYVRNQLY